MTTTKTQKIIIWSLPIAAAVGFAIYLVYGYVKEKATLNPTGESKKSLPKVTKDNVKDQVNNSVKTGSNFPLKKGMTNDAIKQLQDALGVTPMSGYFGDLTAAALKEQTGKTQIDDENDLVKTIQNIIIADSINPEKENKASSILNTYNQLVANNPSSSTLYGVSGGSTISGDIYFSADTTLHQVGADYVIYIKKGQSLSLLNYIPTSIDSDNNLVLTCSTGVNAGKWAFDATNATLKNINQSSLPATVNGLYSQIKSIEMPDNSMSSYSDKDIPFLQAWLTSAQNTGEDRFTYNGIEYYTQTGSPTVTPYTNTGNNNTGNWFGY